MLWSESWYEYVDTYWYEYVALFNAEGITDRSTLYGSTGAQNTAFQIFPQTLNLVQSLLLSYSVT